MAFRVVIGLTSKRGQIFPERLHLIDPGSWRNLSFHPSWFDAVCAF